MSSPAPPPPQTAETASTSWGEFLTSVYFMLGGLAVFIFLFAILHFFDFFKRLLASRMYMQDKNAPPKDLTHAFSWVLPMLRTSEDEVIETCGLDAAVYLRMFRFSFEIFFWLTLMCCPILLPINATAPETPATAFFDTGPIFLTISNLSVGSDRYWAHLVLLYIASAFVLFWTTKTYRHVWALRHDYLAQRAKVLHPEEYTVLVTDIPEAPRLQQSSALHLVIPRQNPSGDGGELLRRSSRRESSRKGMSRQRSRSTGDLGELIGEVEELGATSGLDDLKERDAASDGVQSSWLCSWLQLFNSEESMERKVSARLASDGFSTMPPPVFAVRIPKPLVRTFFRVLRVLTMGFVQPPARIDVAPSTAVSESRQVDGYFHRLYPGAYLHNQGVATYSYVQRAYNKWRQAVTMLDRVRFRYMRAKERNKVAKHPRPPEALVPYHRTGFLGLCGPRVESIPFWIDRVKEISEELKKEQESAISRRRTGTAFVIFNSRRAASVAIQTKHAMHGTSWQVHMAPQPQDVQWANTEARFWERTVRAQVGFVIFLVMVVFFYLPVSGITALLSLENLRAWFPGLTSLPEDGFLNRVLVAVVPPLGLRICYWVVPDLLVLLSTMQGCPSTSSAQQLASQRFYTLLLFNVFFAYVATETGIKVIVKIVTDPQSLYQLLGTTVTSASGFYMAYIMTSTLLLGTELLRLPFQLFIFLFRMASVGKDICDREKLWNQGGIVYHVYFPYQNLIITFGLVYTVIAPLVLPFVLFYSLVGFFIFKHQVMYVYSYPYQTGGLLWIPFVQNVLGALIIGQIITICVFGLKQAFLAMVLAIPLPILTFYAVTLINSMLSNTFKVLPLELAVEVDEWNERTGLAGVADSIGKEYMPISMQPVVNPDLSPNAGPSDNIHELVNPIFHTSELQEAVEAISPRPSLRRYSSFGYSARTPLHGANGGSSGDSTTPLGPKLSLECIRSRAVSLPVLRSPGPGSMPRLYNPGAIATPSRAQAAGKGGVERGGGGISWSEDNAMSSKSGPASTWPERGISSQGFSTHGYCTPLEEPESPVAGVVGGDEQAGIVGAVGAGDNTGGARRATDGAHLAREAASTHLGGAETRGDAWARVRRSEGFSGGGRSGHHEDDCVLVAEGSGMPQMEEGQRGESESAQRAQAHAQPPEGLHPRGNSEGGLMAQHAGVGRGGKEHGNRDGITEDVGEGRQSGVEQEQPGEEVGGEAGSEQHVGSRGSLGGLWGWKPGQALGWAMRRNTDTQQQHHHPLGRDPSHGTSDSSARSTSPLQTGLSSGNLLEDEQEGLSKTQGTGGGASDESPDGKQG